MPLATTKPGGAGSERYDRILLIAHHINKHTGNVFEYFRQNSRELFVFSYAPSFQEPVCLLETFRHGAKKRERRYAWYRGRNVGLKYFFYLLYYLDAVWFRLPGRTITITFHPLFCVLNSLSRLFKNDRTVFWVYDHFPSRKGLYYLYNLMADHYDRRLRHVLYLGTALEDVYRGISGPAKAGYYRGVVDFGVRPVPRSGAPVPGLLGFVGDLKLYQGIRLAYQALKADPSLRLEIMGDGANKEDFRIWAEADGVADRVRFLGYVDEADVLGVVGRWQLGLAPYEPDGNSCMFYAFPGKAVFYLQYGLPVITTKVTRFHQVIQKYSAGVVIDYDAGSLSRAIKDVQERRGAYLGGVERYCRDHEYSVYYDDKFDFLRTLIPRTV